MEFDEIFISRTEKAVLKSLKKKKLVSYDEIDKKIFESLKERKFVETQKVTYNNRPFARVVITRRGLDYLAYKDSKKKKERKESIRYWITTGIAIVALLLSVAALLWQAYTWRHELQELEVSSYSVGLQPSKSSSISESVDCNTRSSNLLPFFSSHRPTNSGIH